MSPSTPTPESISAAKELEPFLFDNCQGEAADIISRHFAPLRHQLNELRGTVVSATLYDQTHARLASLTSELEAVKGDRERLDFLDGLSCAITIHKHPKADSLAPIRVAIQKLMAARASGGTGGGA